MSAVHYALDGLGGIPEFKLPASGWSQAAVSARWAQIGQPAPAPMVPEWLLGKTAVGSKAGLLWYAVGSSRKTATLLPKDKTQAKAVRDFLNFFGKVAEDPYRKQGGISKAAGVILQVASAAIPAFGYFQAAAAAGNYVAAKNAVKTDANLAARVMAPAYSQQAANDQAIFDVQLNKLKSLAPPLASPAAIAQKNFASAKVDAIVHPKSASTLSPWVWFLGAAIGVVIIARVRA